MKDHISSKDKAKEALPLKGGSFPLKRDLEEPGNTGESVSKSNYQNIEEVIGIRKERRECAVGVRVTREMKDLLENLSSKTKLSESEIVFRILRKNLNMDVEA